MEDQDLQREVAQQEAMMDAMIARELERRALMDQRGREGEENDTFLAEQEARAQGYEAEVSAWRVRLDEIDYGIPAPDSTSLPHG